MKKTLSEHVIETIAVMTGNSPLPPALELPLKMLRHAMLLEQGYTPTSASAQVGSTQPLMTNAGEAIASVSDRDSGLYRIQLETGERRLCSAWETIYVIASSSDDLRTEHDAANPPEAPAEQPVRPVSAATGRGKTPPRS